MNETIRIILMLVPVLVNIFMVALIIRQSINIVKLSNRNMDLLIELSQIKANKALQEVQHIKN